MILVPVIDLMGGRVVHARGGERARYGPLKSRLCPSDDPAGVVRGYLGLYPFSILYVADLDAIQGRGDNMVTIRGLGTGFPSLELWVDRGLGDRDGCLKWLDHETGSLVLGSESQGDLRTLEGLIGTTDPSRLILSLDFRDGHLIGPAGLLQCPEIWPERTIAMTLSRIGGGQGPDLDRLKGLLAAAPGKRIYAAGGARSLDDIKGLARLGVSGVLLASALHDGRIGRPEIERTPRPAAADRRTKM